MDQLTRIEKLLERIAVALEKKDQSFNINSDTVIGPGLIDIKDGSLSDWKEAIDKYVADGRWYGPCEPPKPGDFTMLEKGEDVLSKEDAPKGTEHIRQRFGIDYSMMGDDKTADTCRAKFDGIENFGKLPNDD